MPPVQRAELTPHSPPQRVGPEFEDTPRCGGGTCDITGAGVAKAGGEGGGAEPGPQDHRAPTQTLTVGALGPSPLADRLPLAGPPGTPPATCTTDGGPKEATDNTETLELDVIFRGVGGAHDGVAAAACGGGIGARGGAAVCRPSAGAFGAAYGTGLAWPRKTMLRIGTGEAHAARGVPNKPDRGVGGK